jgi:hypothetical protein
MKSTRFSARFSILVVLFACSLASFELAQALRVKDGQVIFDELSDYELCQKRDYSGDWCHDALKQWVKAHPADAFRAGKMTRKVMNAWAAIPFFFQAFEARQGDCKDADVNLAVVSALSAPKDKDLELVSQARHIGIETCFADLKSDLLEKASVGSYLFQNICKDLDARGLLYGLKKKKCSEGKI